MRTIWNNPDKTELNLHAKRVGEIYEENKFTKADNEALNKIRQVTCDGLHDTYVLLEMYLETKGMMIDKTTKEIKNKVKMNITEDYVSFETAKLLKEKDFNIADEKSQCLMETVADYNSMIDEYGDVKLSELRDKAMKELEKIWEKYPVLKPIPEKPQLD